MPTGDFDGILGYRPLVAHPNPKVKGAAEGGEIARTLAWHDAVHTAKEREFGEQSFRGRVHLAQTLIDEESVELMDELRKIKGYDRLEDVPLELRAAAAKEAADVLFVAIQAMHTLGVPFEAVYAEVLASNQSKLEGGVRFRDDGKLLKGPAYRSADVEGVLARHQ